MVCVCAIEFCVSGACENVKGNNSRKSVYGRQQNFSSHHTGSDIRHKSAYHPTRSE